ncbi:hypothetical protein WJX84_000126 [Apatococcus fuscideae]|uniref:Uncharacterized protein n=1 Tax=Apatococcus fuscideae TaxID=2026836 RepID=A0AAW1SZP2_9CHLO
MFCDLCLPDHDDLYVQRDRLAMALRLGFDKVAVEHLAKGRLGAQDRCLIQPLSTEAILAGPAGEQAVLVRDSLLCRAETAGYDLLAVQPLSERLLQQACSSLQVDIICLDLAHRLPFRLRPKVLAPALQRGVMFEVCYAACLRDETSRRFLFSNAAALTRATHGQNIIVSSGARTAFELRGPYDAINLSTLFGLPERHAKSAVSTRCAQLLEQAQLRGFHKQTIKIMEDEDAANGHDDRSLVTEVQLPSREPGGDNESRNFHFVTHNI